MELFHLLEQDSLRTDCILDPGSIGSYETARSVRSDVGARRLRNRSESVDEQTNTERITRSEPCESGEPGLDRLLKSRGSSLFCAPRLDSCQARCHGVPQRHTLELFRVLRGAVAHHDAASAPVPGSLKLAGAFAFGVGFSDPHPTMPPSVSRNVAVRSFKLGVIFSMVGSPYGAGGVGVVASGLRVVSGVRGESFRDRRAVPAADPPRRT